MKKYFLIGMSNKKSKSRILMQLMEEGENWITWAICHGRWFTIAGYTQHTHFSHNIQYWWIRKRCWWSLYSRDKSQCKHITFIIILTQLKIHYTSVTLTCYAMLNPSCFTWLGPNSIYELKIVVLKYAAVINCCISLMVLSLNFLPG